MDGSNVAIVIPINHNNSESKIYNLYRNYSSIQNVELVFVLNSPTNTRGFGKNMVLVTGTWTSIYEAHTLGMKQSSREVILFLDMDQCISVETIERFLTPILTDKTDAVLNNMDYEYRKCRCTISILLFPLITNYFINQTDLKMDSFMFLPYALNRKAIEKFKVNTLDNPVTTHLMLMQNNIRVSRHLPIRNLYKLNDKEWFQSYSQAVDYHLQAYAQCFKNHNCAGFTSGGRRIDLLTDLLSDKGEIVPLIKSNIYADAKSNLSIIIPAQNEEKCIRSILIECKKLNPLEIVVVVNGSSDRTASIAEELGATIIVFEEKLGLDIGRAIGAYFSSGEIVLFLDGDFVIPAHDIKPFVDAIKQGADVALNNQNAFLDKKSQFHPVLACKYALNIACGREDLGICSTVAIPHAYSRKCIETIGYESLANPALSYVKSLIGGLVVEQVHQVDVNVLNRFRPTTHYRMQKDRLAPTTSVIMGDHIEALKYLGKVRYS